MKIRVRIPDNIALQYFHKGDVARYIDDILLWGMETGMDIEHYTTYPEYEGHRIVRQWAVFTVEADFAFMFSLKWGALNHKRKKDNVA